MRWVIHWATRATDSNRSTDAACPPRQAAPRFGRFSCSGSSWGASTPIPPVAGAPRRAPARCRRRRILGPKPPGHTPCLHGFDLDGERPIRLRMRLQILSSGLIVHRRHCCGGTTENGDNRAMNGWRPGASACATRNRSCQLQVVSEYSCQGVPSAGGSFNRSRDVLRCCGSKVD